MYIMLINKYLSWDIHPCPTPPPDWIDIAGVMVQPSAFISISVYDLSIMTSLGISI